MNNELKILLYKKLLERAKKLYQLYRIEEYQSLHFFYRWYGFFLRKWHMCFLGAAFQKFLDYMSDCVSITEAEIEEASLKKISLKGKFDKKIYVEIVGIAENNSQDVKYFKDNVDRYPEISFSSSMILPEKYLFFGCHKLVRDNVLTIEHESGNIVFYKILNSEDFKYAIIDKFIEEITELCEAKSRSNIIEEIGDSREVFHLLQDL